MKLRKKTAAFLCMFLAAVMSVSAAGCGSEEETEKNVSENTSGSSDESGEEPEYDENGDPVMPKENRTDENILASDAEAMITGFVAVMDNGTVTDNGIWMTEEEVGAAAGRYKDFQFTYEKGSFGKSEVKYIACFFDVNGVRLGSMYMDENADMCYDNKYRISDPQLRGILKKTADRIQDDSVLVFDNSSVDQTVDKNTTDGISGDPAGSTQDASQSTGADVDISKKTFMEVEGVDEQTAQVLAQSVFNLGIPAVKRASMEANTIVFTDINDTEYTLSVVDGKISSVYNETEGVYMYQQGQGE